MAYAGSVDSDNSDPNYITPKIDGTKPTDVSTIIIFSYFFEIGYFTYWDIE